jgi:hypothetical protein
MAIISWVQLVLLAISILGKLISLIKRNNNEGSV